MEHSLIRSVPKGDSNHHPIHALDGIEITKTNEINSLQESNYADEQVSIYKHNARKLTSSIPESTLLQKMQSIFKQLTGSNNGYTGYLESPCREFSVIKLAIVYDSSFCSLFGNADESEEKIRNLIEAVSDLYENTSLCIAVKIRDLSGTCDPITDPYLNVTSHSKPIIRLDRFEAYWKMNRNVSDMTIAHLYTGIPLEDKDSGIAYISSICNPLEAGYGTLSFDANCDFVVDRNLIAHEIGHSIGVRDHIGTEQYIMSEPVCADCSNFSQEGLNKMNKNIPCLHKETNELFSTRIDPDDFKRGEDFNILSKAAMAIAGGFICAYGIAYYVVRKRRRNLQY